MRQAAQATGAITYASGTTTVATVINDRRRVARRHGLDDHRDQGCELRVQLGNCDVHTARYAGNTDDRVCRPGPRNVVLATTSDNAASGGSGTGAITYASSNTNALQ